MRSILRRYPLYAAFVLVSAALVLGYFLADEGADGGSRRQTRVIVPSQSARDAQNEPDPAGIPTKPTNFNIPDRDLKETRDFLETTPDGAEARIKWYETGSGDLVTASLIVGSEAGSRRMASADEYASAVGTDAAAEAGTSVDPAERLQIGSAPAIEFTDALGWSSISWAPRDDVLISVNGW
jgi:hypothetical protein